MKLEVVSHQVSLVGKVKELKKIEAALNDFYSFIYGEELCGGIVFDNSVESCNLIDLGFAYDQSEYTIAQIKKFWREFKAQ